MLEKFYFSLLKFKCSLIFCFQTKIYIKVDEFVEKTLGE